MAIMPVKIKRLRRATSDGERLAYLNVFSAEHEVNFDVRLSEGALNGHSVGDEIELEYIIATDTQVIPTRAGGNMAIVNPAIEILGVA